MTDDKKKALEQTIMQIEKEFGKGSIMKLGSYAATRTTEVIPTGCLPLDMALGIGGLPKGRIIEIYGPEASGKTTVTLHVIAQVQKMGGTAAFIDAEQALDPVYAANLGINMDELYISQPDSGEQALDILDYLVKSNAVDLVVVDSVAALTPKAEIEGDMGDSHMGVQARLMSQCCRKIVAAGNKSKTCVIFINQLRDKIGVMFGNPETTTGGKAEFEIIFGKGISNVGCVLDMAVAQNIIEKSGSWFSYNGERIGQGRENVKKYLEDHPEVMTEIEGKLRTMLSPQPATEETPVEE